MEADRVKSLIFSYKVAPIEYRERISIRDIELRDVLKSFIENPIFEEIFILSTCNRTEFYVVTERWDECFKVLKDFIEEKSGEDLKYFEVLNCEESVIHLFEVSGGLDSMILGEPQILGQVKNAYSISLEVGSVKTVLNQLLQKAIRCGKRIRNETEIGFGAVSVSFAVVELAKKIFGRLSGKTATVIGLGEMGKLCVRHLVESGVERVFLCNRTLKKAEEFSKEIKNGFPTPFEEMWEAISNSQIVISSTSSEGYIIAYEEFKKRFKRNFPEIFFADIAIPRDIDSRISKIDGVFLFDIDDLKGMVEKNIERRKREAKKASTIVVEESGKFIGWLKSLDIKEVILLLRDKIEDIRKREVMRYKFRDDKERELIEKFSLSLSNKFLHFPLSFLKRVSPEDLYLYGEIIKDIFKLEE